MACGVLAACVFHYSKSQVCVGKFQVELELAAINGRFCLNMF